MEEYKLSFKKFYEDITLVLKGFLQWKILKPEDLKLVKLAVDSRGELAKELEIFINGVSKHIDLSKSQSIYKETKYLPLRV